MRPVDASRLAERGDSASPWQRLIGIVASGAAGYPAARARFKEALQSPDHFDRCAAFPACTLSMERKKEGGAKAEPDPQFAKAMLACLKSPLFLDRKLAQLGAPQCVPFDDLAALLQDEIRRDPAGERAKLLVGSFRYQAGLSRQDDLNKQRQMTVLDAVLESKNVELQALFFSVARWWFQGNDPLLLTAICECEPQALLAALGDRQYGHLWETDFAARALLERLKAICESADPAVRLLAARSLADFLSQRTVMVEQQGDPRPGILGKDEFRTASLAIVGRMLDDCIAKEDAGVDDERLAAGCGLLAAFVEGASRRGMGWDAMTPGIRAAAVRALGYAGRLVAGEELAGLAGVLWRITEGKDAELAPSLEAARKTIMAGGRPAEQLRLLREAAVFAEEPAIAELQRRFADPDSGFMSDAVSPEERLAGMRALRGSRAAMPDEFAAFLLTCLADTSADVQLRQEIHELLAERPERYGQLLDTLMALANACDGSLPIGKLVAPVRRALAAAEEQKQPRPAWTAKALDYGLAAMNNEELFPSQRAGAMELYAAVAGKDALPTLEAAAFGTGKNAEMRWRAVSAAIAADPGTNLLQKAAQEYGELPTEMRTSLLSIAATAAKTPGAEEFVILVLRDESIEWWRRTEMLRKLALPATPTLLAVLKELEKDKQIGPNAREAANRLRKPPLEKE